MGRSLSRTQEWGLIFTGGTCYIFSSCRHAPSTKKAHLPRPKNPAGGRNGNSQSERDWAHVRSLLKKGVSEETLARQLEAQRQDKPKPAYYAQRTVARAAASLREERSTTQERITPGGGAAARLWPGLSRRPSAARPADLPGPPGRRTLRKSSTGHPTASFFSRSGHRGGCPSERKGR